MKLVYLALLVVVTFSISNSLAQSIGTITPTQSSFSAGGPQPMSAMTPSQQIFGRGLNPSQEAQSSMQSPYKIGSNPSSASPLQSAYGAGNNQAIQKTPATQNRTVMISGVIKEGDGMLVNVASNGTSSATNLTSWRLALNNGTRTYTFPLFTLQPNSIVTVHTQKGKNSPTDLFGSNFIWYGTRDVELMNHMGTKISEYRLEYSPQNTNLNLQNLGFH